MLGELLLSHHAIDLLATITKDFGFSFKAGELQIIDGNWYVTHTGLLRLARRKKCRGHVEAVESLCDFAGSRFVLKATVFPSKGSSGFVGYGDADPSNVSPLVRGAEMRVAETRAVDRALRKAYGIGICSVEEIGSFAEPRQPPQESRKLPPQPANGNYGGPKVRDRLCQLIRQHQLDATLVKSYATDFCGVKTLLVPQYSGTPAGTVTSKNRTTTMGKVLLTGGRAIFTKVFKSARTKSITASYSGNENFTPVQPN